MNSNTHVAIIGAGIGGLTLARALLLRGFAVTLFEQAGVLSEIGAGIVVSPNAVKVLRALELEPQLLEHAFEPEAYTGWDWKSGRALFRTQIRGMYHDMYGAGWYQIHRADLHAMLAQGVPAQNVRLGAKCTGVESNAEGALARFADGSSFKADVIVGADGIHSAVRRSLFGEDTPKFAGIMCWRGMVRTDALPAGLFPKTSSNWHGPHGHVTHYYVRNGTLINFVAVRETATSTAESWTALSSREELLAAYEGWNPRLRLLLGASEHYYKWGLFDRDPFPRWSEGRITLLGDAAHPMLPFLGQGAAQAMEDAYALARLLDGAGDVAAALRRYEAARIGRTARIQLGARARGQQMHLATPWQRFKRDLNYKLQGWLKPKLPANQADWIFRYDVTTALLQPEEPSLPA